MSELGIEEIGHLNYLLKLANQPLDQWEGFYITPADGMNFGLRFQLAFGTYALFGLARCTPAYPMLYANAIERLIEKMLRPETWAYWFRGAVRSLPSAAPQERTKPGAVEILHSRFGIGGTAISPDPCLEGNVQYSGHLSSMIGFYELLGGGQQYDTPGFVLKAEAGGKAYEFPYNHTSLAASIHQQMERNYFHGVCCEPGRAYAACNNHACISNILHDALHGSNYAAANLNWSEWVRGKMLSAEGPLSLPAPNGLLSVAYLPDLHLTLPVSFNFTDAWGLAYMAAWDPQTVRKIYPRFRKRLKADKSGLRLSSRSPNESLEISTEGLNTGFALLLAREMGDLETASSLLNYAERHFNLREEEGCRYFASRPAPYLTSLIALARSLPETGGGLASLLSWKPNLSSPLLYSLAIADGRANVNITVTQAEYKLDEGLLIALSGGEGETVELTIKNWVRPQPFVVTDKLTNKDLEMRVKSNLFPDTGTNVNYINLQIKLQGKNSRLIIS